MALIAREGAEVKVLLKNVFPNLIEAPSVGKGRGEVAPQESCEREEELASPSPIPALQCPAANPTPTNGTFSVASMETPLGLSLV